MKAYLLAACGTAVVCLSAAASGQSLQPVQTTPMTATTPVAPVSAVPAPVVVAPAAMTATTGRMLPAGTVVNLTTMQEISSKHVNLGDKFQFQVVSDVVESGVVVIPRGSIATGVITMKTGRAIGGKSGKFDITFDSLSANGRTFPLMGIHRQEGRGNTVGALLGSIWISGKSAVMVPGQMVSATVKEATAY